MSALANGDVLKIRTLCRLDGQNGFNVSHWAVRSLAGVLQDTDVASQMGPIFSGFLTAWMPSTAGYNGVGVQIIRGSLLFPEVVDTVSHGFGLGGATQLSNQTAGLVRMFGALAGRRFRGYKYLAYPDKAYDDGAGGITAPGLAAAQAIGTVYATPYTIVNGLNNALIQCVLGKQYPYDPNQIVLSATPDGRWSQQKRRSLIRRVDTIPTGFWPTP